MFFFCARHFRIFFLSSWTRPRSFFCPGRVNEQWANAPLITRRTNECVCAFIITARNRVAKRASRLTFVNKERNKITFKFLFYSQTKEQKSSLCYFFFPFVWWKSLPSLLLIGRKENVCCFSVVRRKCYSRKQATLNRRLESWMDPFSPVLPVDDRRRSALLMSWLLCYCVCVRVALEKEVNYLHNRWWKMIHATKKKNWVTTDTRLFSSPFSLSVCARGQWTVSRWRATQWSTYTAHRLSK